MRLDVRWLFVVATAALSVGALPAAAQPYPSKPLHLIVPYPAGGTTDVLARAVGARLATSFGQPVVVENKPGANTIIAATHLAQSAPDGYTILFGNPATYTINPLVYSKLPYNPKTDLAPIALVVHLPECLVINAEVPARNLKEFIAYAKANPGKLNYGSFGPGSPPHLAGEGFKVATGVDLVHVPFKGAVEMQHALLKGEIHAMFTSPNSTMQQISAGKLRALATYSPTRLSQLPDVPTYREEGLQGLDMNTWFGFFAPGKTPAPILDLLSARIAQIVADPEFQKERLLPFTLVPALPGREQMNQVLRDDEPKYQKLVRTANVKLD